MPVTRRPKLPSLATPTSAKFPKDALLPSDALLSASSVRTPHSASLLKGSLPSAGLYSAGLPSAGLPSAPFEYPPTPSMRSATKQEDMPEKTPITPPLAYMDFLKSISAASPTVTSPPLTAPLVNKKPLHRTSTSVSTASTTSTTSTASTATCKTEDSATDSNVEADLDSAPTTASTSSGATDCSCKCELVHKSPKPSDISIKQPPSPLGTYPLSAPASGPTKFPSFRIPPSPAVDSPLRSPYSARSIKSPFDWDAALKAKRYAEVIKPPTSAVGTGGAQSPRCEKGRSVKHIREVVTRTVTYTPRMDPAPKGKRRKLE
ncbi:hypothetical protein VSDG_04924 [Cytospora chrysosperma]|uniref:Uncharacterized protein n=1 Tax=Cytospora chrysosperma TaxID=252740 RepID=A0A423W3E2_CYTCH|nr:hypothetical protein VSDG_04924 [Valsa sordida]